MTNYTCPGPQSYSSYFIELIAQSYSSYFIELIAISQTTQDILITGILIIVLLLVAILITKLI